MPMGSTLDQRVKWHVAHAKACGCREIPPTVLKELRRRGTKAPKRRQGPTVTRTRKPASPWRRSVGHSLDRMTRGSRKYVAGDATRP